jgi:hypothetical protein
MGARLTGTFGRLAAHSDIRALAERLARAADRVAAHPGRRAAMERLSRVRHVILRAVPGAAVRLPPNAAVWRGVGCAAGLLMVPIVGFAGLNLLFGQNEGPRLRSLATRGQASPTATTAPAATEVPAQAPPAPPPQGDHFVLYYDDTALYFHNLSGNDRSIFPIAFERLDENGNPANRFDGWRWGEIYANHRAGYCAVVELIEYRDHLNPDECQDKHIVVRTPFSSEGHIFWTSREGSQQFRVLWNDAEVGRCEIAAHRCEVHLP